MRHREVSLASAYCRGFFCFEGEKEKKALPQRAHRLGWIGGKFEDRNERGELVREVVELRSEPRYPQVNRWHLERWVPAEAYGSPRAWRGEYEHCFTLQGPRGEFVQLTPTIAEHVARAIEWARGRDRAAQRAKLYARLTQSPITDIMFTSESVSFATPSPGFQTGIRLPLPSLCVLPP
jgi:hypothetical protein